MRLVKVSMPSWLGITLLSLILSSFYSRAQEQNLMLENGDYQVPATYQLPVAANKVPALLMLHGTASNKDEVGNLFKRLADKLTQQNVASIRIDFAGTGDSPVDYRHYNLESAVRDAKTALNFLLSQPQIDPHRVAVLGFSQGGLIAQLLALEDPRIHAMVAWSSVAADGIGPFAETFSKYYPMAKQYGHVRQEFSWRPPLELDLSWFEQVRASKALTDMARFTQPLLAIAGTNDDSVPPESALALVNASGSADAQAVYIKGADHIYNVLSDDQRQAQALLTITALWLEHHL